MIVNKESVFGYITSNIFELFFIFNKDPSKGLKNKSFEDISISSLAFKDDTVLLFKYEEDEKKE